MSKFKVSVRENPEDGKEKWWVCVGDIPVFGPFDTKEAALAEARDRGLLSAQDWIDTYSGKSQTDPRADSGKDDYRVLYVSPDELVVSFGRAVAVYPKPTDTDLDLKIDDKVRVKNKEIYRAPARSLQGHSR